MPELVARARRGGFQGQDAAIAAAVAAAESSGNPLAHNPNASTGDNSYGLWQVNMLGGMGPERRREFGINRNEDLFDPDVNARAAKRIHESQGWNAWSVYKSGKYRDYLPQAIAAARSPSADGGQGSPAPVASAPSNFGARLAQLVGMLGSSSPSAPSRGGAGTSRTSPADRAIDRAVEDRQPPLAGLVTGGFRDPQAPGFNSGPGFDGLPEAIGAALAAPASAPANNIRPSSTRMAGDALAERAWGYNPMDGLSELVGRLFGQGQGKPAQAVAAAQPSGTPTAAGQWTTLQGVTTGNTGTSTGPHLDIRWGDRSPIKPEDVAGLLRIGGKSPLDYPVTSPYGPRVHPVHGGNRLHAGFDLGTPRGLPIDVAPGVKVLGKHWDEGGGGWVKKLQTPDGRVIKLLHLDSSG